MNRNMRAIGKSFLVIIPVVAVPLVLEVEFPMVVTLFIVEFDILFVLFQDFPGKVYAIK